MNRKDESYNDALSRIYAYKKIGKDQNSLEITFQVTEACNLNCKYCYQGEKTPKVMTLEVAKKFIDVVFREYQDKKMAIILEFIGGEPLLQADLISDIVDYWDYKCIMENLEWGKFTRFSICSNGVDYFKEASQKLINKLQSCLSFTVSIDGNKELHDSARVHADGSGSYDEAIAAAHDYEARTQRQLGSKMTIAPSNLIFLYPALKHYLDSGAEVIHANCVYENVWKIEDAQFFYKELKRLADYKLEHYPEVELSLFDERHFHQLDPNETACWCGGRGSMLACSPDGILYPCLRYMPSSVGQVRDDYITFGDVDKGVDWDYIQSIQNITRRDTMDDECFWCPIGSGCGECFPAGTFISTPTGKIAIENLQIGDKVYDCNGDIQEITNLIHNKADTLVNLKATGVDSLKVTENHPFLIKNDKGIDWVEAKDIKIGDNIAILTPYNPTKTIDKNIAYLAGRYLGDGYKQNSYRKKNPYRYGIVCGKTEVEELKEKIERTNVGYSYREMRTAYDFKLHTTDTEDAKLLHTIIKEQGRRALDKHVAPEVFTWDKDSIKAYLEGYFDANGYYDKNRDSIKCTSISYQLILDIAELIWITEGMLGYIVPRKSVNNIIEGRKVNTHQSWELSFYKYVNDNRLKYSYDDNTNIIWTPIKSVEKEILDSEIDVYNFSVSNTESYIANRVVVHNCAALSWQESGSLTSRSKNICMMHQARALANVYYWNKYYKMKNMNCVLPNNVTDEWALKIIDQKELDMLNSLC